MPYCPECGNKVSITDKRCSKCGEKLALGTIGDGIKETNPIKRNSSKKYHNIEFALAIITVVFSFFAVTSSYYDYSFMSSRLSLFVLLVILIGVIAAIVTRYHAKVGSIILLLTVFALILFGAQQMILAIVFAVLTAIVAFALN